MPRTTILMWSLFVLACGAGTEAVRPPPSSTEPTQATSEPRDLEPAPPEDASGDPAVTESCGPSGALPAPSDPAGAYRDARALRDAGRLVEAADLAEAIVRAHPHDDVAFPAAELSFDALNHAGQAPHGFRTACAVRIGALAVDYRPLLGCDAPGAPDERCELLERLRCEALRVEAESLAERDEPARASLAFERVHVTGCTTQADEALYNAAVLARRADEPARADALVAELRRAYPDSPVHRAPPP
jgi:hypothetical protein